MERSLSESSAVTDHSAFPKRIPGIKDFWVLIIGECLLFSLFFTTYLVDRSQSTALYESAQQALNRHLGAINTAILIIGSWSVAQALSNVRSNRAKRAARYLMLACGCGITFFCIKIFEYHLYFSRGLYPTTNDFFMFYFVLTMVHLIHVGIGIIVLLVLRSGVVMGRYSKENILVFESGAIYWHMVDLIWIFIFTLFYLLR